MMTSLPSETRLAVSSDFAKPRNPPTPVRPEGLAAWAGSDATAVGQVGG